MEYNAHTASASSDADTGNTPIIGAGLWPWPDDSGNYGKRIEAQKYDAYVKQQHAWNRKSPLTLVIKRANNGFVIEKDPDGLQDCNDPSFYQTVAANLDALKSELSGLVEAKFAVDTEAE